MSLVRCRECGQQVSSWARVCPHCGVRRPAPESPILKKILVVIVIAFVPAIVLMALTNSSNSTSDGGNTPAVQEGSQAELSSDAIGCAGEQDILNFVGNYAQAVQSGDAAEQQDATAAAIQTGCKMEPAGTKGLAMTVVNDPAPVDQLWLPDKEVLWFSAHNVVPSRN